MVSTRGTPERPDNTKKRGGRPPLPIKNKNIKKPKAAAPKAAAAAKGGKKGNTSKKKAPGKVVAAAKQTVAELDGKVYVKAEPETVAGGNYTSDEDLYLSKAWVSVSTDPIKGANQKGETFWKAVHEKMYLIYAEEAEVVMISNKRSWESIKN